MGIGIAADNLWVLGLLVPTLALMHYGVIFREESVAELCRREGIIPNLSYPYRASIQKDADPDIPELIEARERLGELKAEEVAAR